MIRKRLPIKLLLHVLSVALIFFFNTNAYATDSLTVISTSVFQDATRQLTIKEIQKIDSLGLFEKVPPVTNFGYSSDMTWVKVIVSNPSDDDQRVFLQWEKGLTDYVHLYEFTDELEVRHRVSGYKVPESEKEVIASSVYFPVVLKAKSVETYFLQIDSPYGKEMAISLVNRSQLEKNEREFNLFAGAIIFALFIITLYNLFIWISLKDNLYLSFVVANICDTLAASSMLGLNYYIYSFSPYSTSPLIIITTFALFGIFSVNFIIQFLKLRKNHPVWYWVLIAIMIGIILSYIQGIISHYVYNGDFKLVTMFHFLFPTMAFLASLNSYIKGNKNARFLLLGWMCVWIGIVIKLLGIQTIIPSTWFTSNFILIASVLESVLLSFALADRYNRLQKEKMQLEIDVRTKEKDLSMLATNNKIRYTERRNFLTELHELANNESSELRSKLRSLILSLTKELNREEKFTHKSDNIEVLNAEFESRLKSAFPQLTQGDLELCGYIKLNMSLKEIAEIRRTSEGAIKMARHRLKNKLKPEDQGLDDFIQSNF